MWSKLCLGDITRYNDLYKKHLQPPNRKGKNYLMGNLTNAQMEEFFSIKKLERTQLKLPVEKFIEKSWEDNKGLRRQFVLKLIETLGARKDDSIITKKDLKKIETILQYKEDTDTSENEQDLAKHEVPTEKWSKKSDTPKKGYTKHCGVYQQPPFTKLSFSSDMTGGKKTSTPRRAFSAFRDSIWREVSTRSETVIDVLKEINKRWSILSPEEKERYSLNSETRKLYCVCKKRYSEDNGMMVGCEICNDWFHIKWIDVEPQFAVETDFIIVEAAFVKDILHLAITFTISLLVVLTQVNGRQLGLSIHPSERSHSTRRTQ